MDEQRDPIVVASYIAVCVAAVVMVAYQIWASERQHRETSELLGGLDELRARWANLPRSMFDPAEQL